MAKKKCLYHFAFFFLTSFFLASCNLILSQSTATTTHTSTSTQTPTIYHTATFTPSPTPTVTFTYTITPSPSATKSPIPTVTQTPIIYTPTVSVYFPDAGVDFKGEFPGGAGDIEFSINQQGDAVRFMKINFICMGKRYKLDLSRASMKIINGKFAYGSGYNLVSGRFTSSTNANGVFYFQRIKGDSSCLINEVYWNAKAN
ncbi:MAG: hypothetical protein ACK2U1_20335 [Anaerolineales bacterium]